MAETYWVTDRAQIEAVINPVRHNIVDRLVALGPMNVRNLARALGARQTAIYHHLKVLDSVGLVRAVESAGGDRGRPSATYSAVADHIRLARAAGDPELVEPMSAFARMAATQVAREYSAALGKDGTHIDGIGRNLWLFRVLSAPSPERLSRINQLFDELAELVWTPDPKPGPTISVAWFLSPSGKQAITE